MNGKSVWATVLFIIDVITKMCTRIVTSTTSRSKMFPAEKTNANICRRHYAEGQGLREGVQNVRRTRARKGESTHVTFFCNQPRNC